MKPALGKGNKRHKVAANKIVGLRRQRDCECVGAALRFYWLRLYVASNLLIAIHPAQSQNAPKLSAPKTNAPRLAPNKFAPVKSVLATIPAARPVAASAPTAPARPEIAPQKSDSETPTQIAPTPTAPTQAPPTDSAPAATPAVPTAPPLAAKAPAPTPVPTPTFESPITAPNTDAPRLPPAPGLPNENEPASGDARVQNPQFQNPNLVVPAPPLTPVGEPAPGAQIASTTPNGPPILPPTNPGAPVAGTTETAPNGTPNGAPVAPNGTLLPGQTPPPESVIQSGDEGSNDNLSLESDGLVTDEERGLTLSRSPVTLRYREFTAKGDRALVDYNTNIATLAGNLTITARGQNFTGNTLSFNIQTGRWTLSSLQSTFPPDLFPPGSVLEPIYLLNGTVNGDYEDVAGENFKLSTCNRGHYDIRSKKLQFYRNRGGEPSRIVLRRSAVYVYGKKIVPLPVYVFSLLGTSTRRQPLQSTFGQNAVDGYFVRSLYDLRANSVLSDSLLIDTLQKRGLGLGFQRQYAATAGLLYLYGLNGKNGEREVNARLDRTYQLTKLIRSNIRFDSTQITSPSGLSTAGTAQTTTTRNGTFAFSRVGELAQTNATLGFNNSSYGFGASTNGTVNIDHRQNFGSGYALEATTFLSRSQTGASSGFAGSDSATQDNTLVISKAAKAFDAFLRADTHTDLVNDRAYNLERVPELTLQSSTARLPIPGLKDILPGNFTLAMGRFNEPTSNTEKNRANFFYTPDSKDIGLLGSGKSQSRLGVSGNFEQAFYSDDTARYNYALNLVSTSTAGPAQLQVNYAKQTTKGFTPFQFDFFTPGEYLDYNFSLQSGEKFRLNITGGRDIQNGYTRDAVLTAQFVPTPRIYASLGTSYRLQTDAPGTTPTTRFGEVYANVRLNRNRNRFGGGAIALGLRYSPLTSKITQGNGSVDVNLGRRTRIQGLVGYDGFTSKFDFSQIRLTRDLHCFNLYATYDGQRKSVRFDLALKAFPFADTRFGRNQTQEGFDASVGGIQ